MTIGWNLATSLAGWAISMVVLLVWGGWAAILTAAALLIAIGIYTRKPPPLW